MNVTDYSNFSKNHKKSQKKILKIKISVDHIIKEITTITNNKMTVNVLES